MLAIDLKKILVKLSVLILAMNCQLLTAEELPFEEKKRQGAEEGLKYLRVTEGQARTQLDYLMANSSGRFEAALAKAGTFYPYAAVVKADGKVKFMRIDQPKDGQYIKPAVAVKFLRTSLKAAADSKQIVGSALYYISKDSSKEGETPITAVSVELEHAYGISFGRVISFELSDGEITYGDSGEKELPKRIFVKEKQ